MTSPHRHCAFTIVEMIVVVTIIALLVAIAVPGVGTMMRESNWAAAENIIQTALRTAKAHAGAEQRNAGIRFQPDPDGRQWLVLIEQTADGTGDYLAVANRKPTALPKSVAVVQGDVADNADLNTAMALEESRTFSFIFSPQAQMAIKDVLVDQRNDDDDVFGLNGKLLNDIRAGVNAEPSVTTLILYDQDAFQQADDDGLELYNDFINRYDTLENVKKIVINLYTGGIIEDFDWRP